MIWGCSHSPQALAEALEEKQTPSLFAYACVCIYIYVYFKKYFVRENVTCVELFEYIIFGEFWIQVRYVADVSDAIAQAADFKIFLGERLDVLDLLSTIWQRNK